jgi:SNF2 family DNA or RNA helicase
MIDEAHSLPFEEKAKRRTERQYKILDYLIHAIKGMKVLLLTATPMKNSPYELVNLLKLILPKDNNIRNMNEKEFEKEWFDPNTHEIKNPKQFNIVEGNIVEGNFYDDSFTIHSLLT